MQRLSSSSRAMMAFSPRFAALLAALVAVGSPFGLSAKRWNANAPRRARPNSPALMVFSGIVEEMGDVVSLTHDKEMTMWDGSVGRGTELVVDGPRFSLGLSPETLRRTNLGELVEGAKVNLERSLAADGRNSGHYVQGHVDGTGTVQKTWVEGDSLWVEIAAPPDLLACIVPKGYIAVDGTSLTVCDVTDESFTLMLIEHTQKCIVLPLRDIGDAVNLEVDVIAKYARRSVGDFEALSKRVADLEAKLDKLAA
ncbi:riboflavin synthase [Aureococcus anophagefferens]|nr:riboflavin synthase [Aureococcus anophagefferens]